ncbi:hypothetical protein AS159_09890 [Thermotoga sp. Ku-13t]|uniref:HD domain-containing phosphohydrolase n=1 Tax=Thermotoga sp. Ku-13t TaxID=1755813 RepID=UPI0013EAAD79|nr:HD domain-containing phosphohydrolase [Thermotoga sp. Ku-13t]KAF2957321.1 hypothetical protein AS159_09890 [Thermotoga sp. Ku-13t]
MKRAVALFCLLFATLCFCEQVRFVSGDFYPPFIYRNERQEVVGISVEILKAIEKASDLRFDVELMPFSEALKFVETGQADMINLIFKTPEREKIFLFSKPILKIQSLVWLRKELKVKDFKDLSAFVVGVIEGDANEILLRQKNPSIMFKRFESFEQLIQAVENREIDAFLMEDLTASYYLIKHDLYHLFESLPPVSVEWAYFAFARTKPQLVEKFNAALDRLAKGEIERIINLFVKPRFFVPAWLWWVILIGSVGTFSIFMVLILINKRLERLVTLRTEELRKKNEELQASYEEIEAMNQELQAANQELDAMNQELRATNEELGTMNQELMNLNKQLEEKTKEAERFQKGFQDVLDLTNRLTFETIQEKEFLLSVLKTFKDYLPASRTAGVVLRSVSEPGRTLVCFTNEKDPVIQRIDESFDFTSESARAEILKTLAQFCAKKEPSGAEFVPITSQDTVHGVLLYSSEGVSAVEKQYVEKFARFIATLLSLRSYMREQGIFQKRLLSVVVKALEYYDYYTRGHSENVARYASLFAESLGLDRSIIRRLFWAGMVHDVGKIFVPQQILSKNGLLSVEEYELVKIHPVKSFELLNEAGLEEIAKIARHHHERYDGKGYPDGLMADAIPFESRILAVADAFDAMTTNRPYKRAMTLEEAILEIERCSGSQFDPHLAEAFVKLLREKSGLFLKKG